MYLNTQLRGCFYDFSSNLWKYIQNLGLQNHYQDDENFVASYAFCTSFRTAKCYTLFMLLMFSMIDCLVLLPRTINWNFFGLGFIEFTLNHFSIFCVSNFTSFKIVCRLILQLYIVLSSAKLHILVLSIKRKKRSLINKLKNNGPNTCNYIIPVTIRRTYFRSLLRICLVVMYQI